MHDPANELTYQKREENVVYNACTTCECGILCRVRSIACMMRDRSAALMLKRVRCDHRVVDVCRAVRGDCLIVKIVNRRP